MNNQYFYDKPELLEEEDDEVITHNFEGEEDDEDDELLTQDVPLRQVLEDESAVGYRMGKYYVPSGTVELGKGGQGRIYECRCEDDDKTYVAKIYKITDKYIEHIKSINKKVKNLASPNLVHIYAEGDTEDGNCYMVVMEKYEELREDFLNFSLHGEDKNYRNLVRDMVKDIVEGLKTIHAFGIYHSDIKPGNIMCYRGQDGRMHGVLIDFGGSAAVQAEVQRNGGKNAPANVFSRGYQAPELLSGRVHEVSERTDAYSFGVTLAELIAGVYPYIGDIRNERATEKQKKYYQRNVEEGERVCGMLLPKGLPKHMVHLLKGLLYYDIQEPDNLKYRWTDSQIDTWCEYANMGADGYKSILAMPVGIREKRGQKEERSNVAANASRRSVFISYDSEVVPVKTTEEMAETFFEHWVETVDRLMNKRDWTRGFMELNRSIVQVLNDMRERMLAHPGNANAELGKFIEQFGSNELKERCKKVLCIGQKMFKNKEHFAEQLYNILVAEEGDGFRQYDKSDLFYQREVEFGTIFRKGILKQYLLATGSPTEYLLELCDNMEDVCKNEEYLGRYDIIELYKLVRLLKGNMSYKMSNGKVYYNANELREEIRELRYDESRMEELETLMEEVMHKSGETKLDFIAFSEL